jgi:hypothetical protein
MIQIQMGWARYVACMDEMRRVYKILAGKPEERDHLEDILKDNIKIDLRE